MAEGIEAGREGDPVGAGEEAEGQDGGVEVDPAAKPAAMTRAAMLAGVKGICVGF